MKEASTPPPSKEALTARQLRSSPVGQSRSPLPESPCRSVSPLSLSEPAKESRSGSAAAPRWRQTSKATPQRRIGRSRQPAVLSEADAARNAQAFTMEAYRDLHQREFHSKSEELHFLRIDFVASRKTLVVLKEENVRLAAELLRKTEEVSRLQTRIEDLQRDPQRIDRTLPRSHSTVGTPLEAHPSFKGLSGAGESSITTPAAPPPEGLALYAATASMLARPRSTAVTPRSPQRSVVGGGSHRASSFGSTGSERLIVDLRSNLARRDTALNEAQMELFAAQHARDELEKQLREAQTSLSDITSHRNRLQEGLSTAEQQRLALEVDLRRAKEMTDHQAAQIAELKSKLTTADVLYRGAPPPVASASFLYAAEGQPLPASSGLGTVHSSVADTLREQVDQYRLKWQAAEDQVEHLNHRISQLQRQLLLGAPGVTAAAAAPQSSSTDVGGEVEAIRRKCGEEVQLQAEEVQRLQRRLAREQETAVFREDQLRLQRQEDARLHTAEVQTLQEQLRGANKLLAQEQEDRAHLVREVRRLKESSTTAEVLQGQVQHLRQRLAEIVAEAAQNRGSEKQTNLNLQREKLEHVQTAHDLEVAQQTIQESRRESQLLQQELEMLREQLGSHQSKAKCHELPHVRAQSPSADASSPGRLPCCDHCKTAKDLLSDDPDALASELKGYAALMRINGQLQRRVKELEADLVLAKVYHGQCSCCPSAAPSSSPTVPPPLPTSVVQLQVQVTELREELQKMVGKQQSLVLQWTALHDERDSIAKDNVILAEGAVTLQREIERLRKTCKDRRLRASRVASPSLSPWRPSRIRCRLQLARHCAEGDANKSDEALAATTQRAIKFGCSAVSGAVKTPICSVEWSGPDLPCPAPVEANQQPNTSTATLPPQEQTEETSCMPASKPTASPPPPHLSQSLVYGSLLPPVHYPLLSLHSSADAATTALAGGLR